MIRFILDTNACINAIRMTSAGIRNRLQALPPDDVAISEIVRFELEYGACHSRHPDATRAALEHFLRYIRTLDWGEPQAREAADIRCQLARAGLPIGPYDVLIAAHARSIDATLVTHNTREFGRVAELRIEDWETS